MPANEFEKQVQNRLEDFQLSPSASVWKNVEAQIRRKKRRRVIFFLLLPIALGLLGYSFYYFLNSGERTGTAQHEVTINNKNSSATDITKPVETQKPSTEAKTEIIQPVDAKTKQPQQKTVLATKDKTAFRIIPAKSSTDRREDKPATNQNGEIVKDKTNFNDTKDKKANVETNPINNIVSTNDKPVVTTDKSETGRVTKSDTETQPIKANEIPEAVVSTPKDLSTVKTDSAKKEDAVVTANDETLVKKKTSRLKMRWGFDVSGGFTSNQTQAFSLLKSRQADAVFSNIGSSGMAASPFPGAAATLPPSSVKPGAGFKLGVVGEMELSKRSRISVGLQYLYASNRIKTGTADWALRYQTNQNSNNFAAVDQIYRGPQNNNYTNSYHFVSLPLAYHWQINRGTKTGIQWNVGVSPAYLVSTTALVYSSSNGGSYHYDKNAFSKFHFSINTGLSLRLRNKAGMNFILGPEVSFDTRQLMSNPYQRQQYMIYGGIGARILFPLKKK